jgi:hypothetical protein
MKKDLEVLWRGHVVGRLSGWSFDMFHLYGKWRPAGTASSVAFEEVLTEALDRDEQVEVDVGGADPPLRATAVMADDGTLEVVVWPSR